MSPSQRETASRPSAQAVVARAAAPQPAYQFRPHNGTQMLFVQGKSVPPVFADVQPATQGAEFTACAEAGITLFRIRNLSLGWTGGKRFDPESVQGRIAPLLKAVPGARFLLELNVDAPAWWLASHTSECAGFCLEPRQNADEKAPKTEESTASWASSRWVQETSDALARLAQYIEKAEWGGQCLGYQVAAGVAGTWQHHHASRMPDVSPRMTERFRAFCLDKYRRNTGLLRKGWDDPRADFDRIYCPNARERRYADVGIFRDTLRSRRILDYYECFYTAQNEAALQFCTVLKRASQGRALVGLAYAVPFGNTVSAEGTWGLPEPVFESPEVDFFVLPSPAPQREQEAAEKQEKPTANALFPCPPGFTGSLALRQKFVFFAADDGDNLSFKSLQTVTHLAGMMLPANTPSASLKSVVHLHTRALSSVISLNKRASQIAVIVDAASPTYLTGKEEIAPDLQRAFFTEQMQELGQTGAPFDVFLLSDLFQSKFQDHKVYVFLNCFYLSEAERRRIDARLKRSNQVGVWLWGAGLLSEEGTQAETLQKVTALKLRMEKTETSMRTRIVEANDPLTWGFHVGSRFGMDRSLTPTLTVTDKRTVRLGANSDNKTTFAVLRGETWTSVHFGTLPVSAALLRNVLRAAGCHLYAGTNETEDVVLANARIVALWSKKGGTRKIFLPGAFEVMDALTEKRLPTASEIETKVPTGQAVAFERKALPRRKEPERDND